MTRVSIRIRFRTLAPLLVGAALAVCMAAATSPEIRADVTASEYKPALGHNIVNLSVSLDGRRQTADFLDFYRRTGGLERWGHPTSEVFEETPRTLTQYFQRGVVDWKPDDSGPYALQRRLAWDFVGGGARGAPDWGVERHLTSPYTRTAIGPWDHGLSNWSVAGTWTGFADYFSALGGVSSFGYPKTDARRDDHPGAVLGMRANSPSFVRQYFQAAVLEFHPGARSPVKIGLIGDVLRGMTYPNATWRGLDPFLMAPFSTTGPYRLPAVVRSESLAKLPLAVPEAAGDDRTDDLAGPQIHVMYVVPSDRLDRKLHLNGTLHRSVDSFQRWLAARTGGRALRLDTYRGDVDISFYRLQMSEADLADPGVFPVAEVERELAAAGLLRDQKIYAIYLDGPSSEMCGGAAWPPALPGRVAAVYLQAYPGNALGNSVDAPGYWDFAMLHDVLHTLGVVARCAPNHTRAGHTSDDPRDLMYAGNRTWRPDVLDVGNDDYYGHTNAGCPDLARSVFLDPPVPNAELPPGWSSSSPRGSGGIP